MTILEGIASLTHTQLAPRHVSRLLRRARRSINNAVAAVIAHRQRQADLAILWHLGNRELKDIGLYRSQIELGLEAAARERGQLQMRDHH
jgi:uncharacterized protein YjiS (DUF1127 family)